LWKQVLSLQSLNTVHNNSIKNLNALAHQIRSNRHRNAEKLKASTWHRPTNLGARLYSPRAYQLGITIAFEGEGLEEVAKVAPINPSMAEPTITVVVGDVLVGVDEKYYRPTEVETLLGEPGNRALNNRHSHARHDHTQHHIELTQLPVDFS
jgi:hypothetical protein